MREKQLAILISGNGSTMEAIVKAQQSGRIDLDIACVISSNPNTGGIKKAKNLGFPEQDILIIPNQPVETFESRLLQPLQERRIDLFSQCGWLPLTPKKVIENYFGTNGHQGNTNDLGGKDMWGLTVPQAAINYNKAIGGGYKHHAVIQRVAPNFDEGQILKAAPIEILPDDTAESLQKRGLLIEHELLISFLEDYLKGEIHPVILPKITDPQKLEILARCKQDAINMHLNKNLNNR